MRSRNMSSFRIPKKEIYEDYNGRFHVLVPNRQLTPNNLQSRPSISKIYRMPVVKRKVSEGLKYSDNDTSGCSVSNLSDPPEVYWHKVELTSWKPETRQNGTLTLSSGQLYLIGGISKEIHSHVYVFHPMTKKWEKYETRGCAPRFGHVAVDFDKNLIIFGGGTDYNQAYKLRECISGIYLYQGGNSQWQPMENKGLHIVPRKFHAGCVIGRQFFVYGGMDNRNRLLSEVCVYDFGKSGWITPVLSGNSPGPRAFHTISTVLNPDQFPMNLFNLYATKYLNVRNPGLYVFGGIKDDGKPCNDLHILDLYKSPPSWFSPFTTGIPPRARMNHSMTFVQKLSVLLIYGGKAEHKSRDEVFLADVVILRVDILHWSAAKVFGDIPCARAGLSMEAIGSRVFIFGGITQAGYCSSDLYALELNPRNVRAYLQDEKQRSNILDI